MCVFPLESKAHYHNRIFTNTTTTLNSTNEACYLTPVNENDKVEDKNYEGLEIQLKDFEVFALWNLIDDLNYF